ncbi:MAG: hypothetical protein AAFV33_19425 [Chloroflexota bacterium]
MAKVEMEMRNLPLNRLQEYLVEAGSEQQGERSFVAEHWSAKIEEMEPAKIITMIVRRDMVVIEGDEDEVERVHKFMRGKTMRGGG